MNISNLKISNGGLKLQFLAVYMSWKFTIMRSIKTYFRAAFTRESLVILKLKYVTLMDVPTMVCLPCLKTLQLESVTYVYNESLQRLLSICPVLEELSVHFGNEATVPVFSIIVPSLQILSLFIAADIWHLIRYEIDTPSLKYFKLEDGIDSESYCEIKNMPNLREAYVDAGSITSFKCVVGPITSTKRLTICLEDNVYGDGFVLNELEHLKICVCQKNSLNLLAQLLRDSPNLRVLEILYMEGHEDNECDNLDPWNQPSHVPECLLSSLQFFKWSQYSGRPQERDIAVYMLKNACRLEKVTILADTRELYVSNLCMIKELTLSSRASSTCELVFAEWHHVVSDE
ncbi:unnamed protein product [Microthlaspi erraticum]|uniref:FBD domain-containing protein n=1 Tax=Microthlaspi erraticum TaxID=1685480 RepID=A0A6D2KEW3_9BRAS|nr:unnamed protein product [Microthlaspi erraticum]